MKNNSKKSTRLAQVYFILYPNWQLMSVGKIITFQVQGNCVPTFIEITRFFSKKYIFIFSQNYFLKYLIDYDYI